MGKTGPNTKVTIQERVAGNKKQKPAVFEWQRCLIHGNRA
jgi:hypothetical protein